MTQIGALRIWWVNNLVKFHYDVNSVEEAIKLLNMLAQYDLALGETIVWNSGGLERFEEDYNDDATPFTKWFEYVDEDGYDIQDLMRDDE